jgi:hypothetical protein
MSMYEKRKALLIGVNNYDHVRHLRGCENDVKMMKEVLLTHDKGDQNFSVVEELNASNESIQGAILSLLARKSTHALLYFSGHGQVNEMGGFICGKDTSKNNPGVSMDWVTEAINNSSVPEVTVILDCCFAGEIANDYNENNVAFTKLRKGVTILAATTEDDTATEFLGRGTFTSILYNGLKGSAKDILGHVTAVGLYNNAESILSPWQQRPVFKSFVEQVTPLRFCLPTVRKRILRSMMLEPYFITKNDVIELNKQMLDDAGDSHLGLKEIYVLSSFEKAGLIECPDRMPLIQAINENQKCQLSPFGKFVWDLFSKKLA